MYQRLIASLLVVLLTAPLNASAAAWMAMSMNMADQHGQHTTAHEADHGSHSAANHIGDPGLTASAETHQHDAADCEEHCASCTNHCSSLGIVSSTVGVLGMENQSAGAGCGDTTSRLELLFRPPIPV